MRKSLWLKTAMLFIIMSLCLVLLAGCFLIYKINKSALSDFYNNSENILTRIFDETKISGGNMLGFYIAESDYSSVYAYLMKYSKELGIDEDRALNLLDERGGYLVGSGSPGDNIISNNTKNVINNTNKISYEFISEKMTFAYPVKNSSQVKYIINIVDNKNNYTKNLRNLYLTLAECFVILLFLSIILAYFYSRYIIKPIEKLKTGAIKISDGDYDYSIDTHSSDEIGELEEAFNNMAVKVKNTIIKEKSLNEKQKTFIADASHELRTPLTAVKSYAEAIIENKNMDDKTRNEFLNVISNESERMQLITEKLLSLAKLDNNYYAEKTNVDISDAATLAYASVKAKADLKNIKIYIDMEKYTYYINKNELFEIIENLITNAIKYTHENDIIYVKSEISGENYIMKVIDNGEGISKEDIDKIFNRFYRVNKARSRQDLSFGLGLSIVKELADKNNIKIEVISQIGKGSTFILIFNS